jgi:shikimate kinase
MNTSRTIHNVALCGFMGSGKSSVGRALAAILRFTFLDTDAVIESRAGKSITEIFAQEGEPAFRVLEAKIVQELEGRNRTVISTGGGLIVNPLNMESLKRHALVVCLWATPETILSRIRHHGHRPLLAGENPLEKIRTLLAERTPAYKQADVLINTEFRSTPDIAHLVAKNFRAACRPQPAGHP